MFRESTSPEDAENLGKPRKTRKTVSWNTPEDLLPSDGLAQVFPGLPADLPGRPPGIPEEPGRPWQTSGRGLRRWQTGVFLEEVFGVFRKQVIINSIPGPEDAEDLLQGGLPGSSAGKRGVFREDLLANVPRMPINSPPPELGIFRRKVEGGGGFLRGGGFGVLYVLLLLLLLT